MRPEAPAVPASLRVCFIVHFAIDFAFAVPLFLFPVRFLGFVGWANIDPVTTRLVAAALFGIGIESLIGSRASAVCFRSLLNLKIIWSVFAVCGIFISIAEMAWRVPVFLWLVFGTFVAFNGLWTYWRIRLR